MKRYAIGIDIGGTNIRISIVDEDGNMFETIKESTNAKTSDDLIDQIESLIDKVDYQKYNVCGLGIGIPGPVNSDNVVMYLPNLNISKPFDLTKRLNDKYHLPIYVGNDANVAGLAEAYAGSGKGYDVVQYLTISTGIGGGLIINKKMIVGKTGQAQEVGSMVVNIGGRAPSPYKPKGCIEGEASGRSLFAKSKEAGLNIEHTAEIFKLASENNQIAKKIVDDFIEYMAAFISSIECYIEPDVFVLGGGVMKSKEYFLDRLISRIDDYVYDSLKVKIIIKCAKFGQDCGIIGAAMQCFN